MSQTGHHLKDIPIRMQAEASCSIGNVRALLTEIVSRLEKLLASGETGMMDLNGLPFAPGEYEQLRQTLGQGEVSARIEAIGASEIVETSFPGVWWVTHYNVEGDIVADLIEIAWLPEIIRSQSEDVHGGLQRLKGQLDERGV